MLEQLLSSISSLPSWLGSVVTLVTGGGLFAGIQKLWSLRMDSEKQEAQLGRKMRDELKNMLDEERSERRALEKRVDKLEERLNQERERRLEAERQNQLLQKKLDLVIQLLNDMREEQGMERLTVDELTLLAMTESDS